MVDHKDFILTPDLSYKKDIGDNVSVLIDTNDSKRIALCIIYNTIDKNIYNEYMFTFKCEPADKDINNMFKFVDDYVIPRFKNNDNETKPIDEARKVLTNVKALVINNEFGFVRILGLPSKIYEKTIDGTGPIKALIKIEKQFKIASLSIYNKKENTVYRNYIFIFSGEPTDDDVNNMFNFTNCYVIPYFNKDGEREAFEKGRCVLTNVDYIGRGGVPVSSILTTDRGEYNDN